MSRPNDRAAHMVVAAPSSVAKAPAVGPPQLHRAAETYLGNVGDSPAKTPQERLVDLPAARSSRWISCSRNSKRRSGGTTCRTANDVVRLFDKGRVNLLVLPFAAGLHNLERSGRLSVGDLNEDQIRLAVTILYTLPQQLLDPEAWTGAARTDRSGSSRCCGTIRRWWPMCCAELR